MMERSNVLRQSSLFLAVAAWAFLLLALGSFHANDWPSHTVYPWPPIQNLCGSAGAFVAYYCFLGIGQGVFPVLFFSGVLTAAGRSNPAARSVIFTGSGRPSDPSARLISTLIGRVKVDSPAKCKSRSERNLLENPRGALPGPFPHRKSSRACCNLAGGREENRLAPQQYGCSLIGCLGS